MVFSKIIFRLSRRNALFALRNVHSVNYEIKSKYEIPEEYKVIQICIKKLIEDLQKREIQLSDREADEYIRSVVTRLEPCERSLELLFPLQRDSGKWEIIEGYRVHHCSSKVPCLGGIRLCPDLSLASVKGLATISTFQNSCMELPFGGSFGGIRVNPNDYNPREMQRIISSYTLECAKHGFMNPALDIFEPDSNISWTEMGWMAETYQKSAGFHNINSCAVIAGKPLHRAGLDNFKGSGGQGVFYGADHILTNNDFLVSLNMKPGWKDKTFIVQGIGKIGLQASYCFTMAGAVCVGIQDRMGSIYCSDGIDIKKIEEYLSETKTVVGYPEAQKYDGEIVTHACDFLILAATERTVHYNNSQKINTKLIIEAANGSITPVAQRILMRRNILILPDIYTGSGTSIAAYMEYLKNINHIAWGRLNIDQFNMDKMENTLKNAIGDDFNQQHLESNTNQHSNRQIIENSLAHEQDIVQGTIDQTMHKAATEIFRTIEEFGLGIDVREACYVMAVRRLFQYFHESGRFK